MDETNRYYSILFLSRYIFYCFFHRPNGFLTNDGIIVFNIPTFSLVTIIIIIKIKEYRLFFISPKRTRVSSFLRARESIMMTTTTTIIRSVAETLATVVYDLEARPAQLGFHGLINQRLYNMYIGIQYNILYLWNYYRVLVH